jgi:hypothetical protein
MRARTSRKIMRPMLLAVAAACAMTMPYAGARSLASSDQALTDEAGIAEASEAPATIAVSMTGLLVDPAKPNGNRADEERQDAERKRRDREIEKCMNDVAENDGSFQDHVACQYPPGTRAA